MKYTELSNYAKLKIVFALCKKYNHSVRAKYIMRGLAKNRLVFSADGTIVKY